MNAANRSDDRDDNNRDHENRRIKKMRETQGTSKDKVTAKQAGRD